MNLKLMIPVAFLFLFHLSTSDVSAQNLTWIESDPQVTIVSELYESGCEKSQIDVITPSTIGIPADTFTTKEFGCIARGKTIDFAYGANTNYIRFHGYNHYHRFGGSLGAKLLPFTDVLVQRELRSGAVIPTKLVFYRDLPNMMIEGGRNNFGQISDFYPDSSKGEQQLTYVDPSDGELRQQSVLQFAVSPSGQYVLAYADSLDLTVIKISDGTKKIIAKLPIPQYVTSLPYMAISNNGAYVFIENLNRIYGGYDCGDLETVPTFSYYMKKPCGESSFGEAVRKIVGYYPKASYVNFSFDDQKIDMIVSPNTGEGSIYKIELRMFGYKDRGNLLDYLALGDSYSSGEGDTGTRPDGSSYYLTGTEHDGGCHLSARSYPFLLSQIAGSTSDRMKSVACSGARITKDYFGQVQNYLGQQERLKGMSTAERDAVRVTASKDFTPGILKQIDFVRTNKPKVVTVMGGGNDVGFSNIVKSCAYTLGVGSKTGTCDEAMPGSLKRGVVGSAISAQFDEVKKLIVALKEASSTTTIYMIGYPTFLAEGSSTCANSAVLTQQEREGINEGVRYLNSVIKAASKSAGAHYVDIESSLSGGRLCEGSEYMTGILSMIGGTKAGQTFHPNNKGHVRMADTIRDLGFKIAASNNPAPIPTTSPFRPDSFYEAEQIPTFQERMLEDAFMVARKANVISLAKDMALNHGDNVRFTLYSKPVNLGTFAVESDGTLTATVLLPKTTELGVHMLVADIVSVDGSKKRLYQYVEVRSQDEADIDGDRIPNSVDQCFFIKSWIDEVSGEDICKRVKINGSLPGRGVGHGYGHVYSNGQHAGHDHLATSSIFNL